MRRFDLFEWEDQPWLPRVFRDFITDHLRYTMSEPMREPVNRAVAERLKSLLDRSNTTSVVDLCAGGGGPLSVVSRVLRTQLRVSLHVTVTDLYPNVTAFKRLEEESGGTVTARYESTSAFNVPADLKGVRTMFTALHHFTPDQARLVLADAVRKGTPIAIFEPLERTFRMLMLLGVVSFLRGFTHTPFVGRLDLKRFLLTYVVPLAPFIFAWDGAVSVLRSYTVSELEDIASSVGASGYRWEVGRFEIGGPYGPMPTTYLMGTPDR